MTARDAVLARIRQALADRPAAPPIPRDYTGLQGAGDLDLFAERVADYRATVFRSASVDAVLADRGIARIVVPAGLPAHLVPGIDTVTEPVDLATLDEIDAVVTTCAVAIAMTGTIVLDAGPGMGPRALSLVPDYHLLVVRPDQIVTGVPDALERLDPTRPLTWISGPSATSDIELDRVEGVHGPRTLDILIDAGL
ncbi:MAG TPA: LUD domain-containing protein [Jatrophihabitans sp.]|jgi:L-lactate dehydrogenase complex protein LldG